MFAAMNAIGPIALNASEGRGFPERGQGRHWAPMPSPRRFPTTLASRADAGRSKVLDANGQALVYHDARETREQAPRLKR